MRRSLLNFEKNLCCTERFACLAHECGQDSKFKEEAKTAELLDLARLKIHIGNLPVFVQKARQNQRRNYF